MIHRMTRAGRAIALALLVTMAGCSPAANETGAGEATGPATTPVSTPTTTPASTAAPATTQRHACAACHAEQSRFHAYGAHAGVTCAQCHGCEGDHTRTEEAVDMPGNAECLACHPLDSAEKGADGVFERHLSWVEKKHVVKIDRKKAGDRCLACHDPHLGE